MGRGAVILVVALVSGCAAPTFSERPIVWAVDDTRTIAEPKERKYLEKEYMADVFVLRRLTRALELKSTRAAANTNALDEVPDSTWFTNRIGVRQVAAGEAADQGRKPVELPLTIVRGKQGGNNAGFIAADSTGRVFLVKFDTRENPELQTSAGAIVNRIFWTAGYNTPTDQVVRFRRDQLSLGKDARLVDQFNNNRLLTDVDIAAILATAPRMPDGRFRALTSMLLPGTPKGGFAPEGRRADDPNDVFDHEDRREVRGLYVFCSWVGHSDIKEDNTLDMYVEEGGRKFLRHYLLDFGEALGGHRAEKNRMEDGYEHWLDWEAATAGLLSLGLWKRRWEDLKNTRWRSIGAFTADHFDPRGWREAYPFWPFFSVLDEDGYWAAKIVMRFDRPLLEAIVARGELSDPQAAAYLVDTLIARRDLIGRSWFERVSPLDDFAVTGDRLCMADLAMRHQLEADGVVQVLNAGGEPVSDHTLDARGRVCVPIASAQYTVHRLRIRRGHTARPPMQVHTKDGRLLGVIRVER